MTDNRQRRRFTKEFKTEAVELALRSNKAMIEIAGGLGIRPELLYRWKSDYMASKEQAFPGSGHLHDPEEEQVRRLERELRSTQEERDILKKALAIFSLSDRQAGKAPR
ncbi:MAG: transposase [Candidatus Marinimicrobia bacterium]|nr:transposase [Candidatus Neomarinimicrobiota bacterium]